MADMEDLYTDDEEEMLENKYLMCVLGGAEYGVNITHVQSIEELQKIVHIPDLPEYVKGVINLRSQVIPVIDLRLKFHMEERDYDDRTCIVIVRIDQVSIGLIVDTVSEVKDIPENAIDPAPKFHKSKTKNQDKYISGLGKIGNDVKILLDITKLLETEELEFINETVE